MASKKNKYHIQLIEDKNSAEANVIGVGKSKQGEIFHEGNIDQQGIEDLKEVEPMSFDSLLSTRIRFGRIQYKLLLIMALIMFNDGAGALVISLILPVLNKEFNINEYHKTLLMMLIFIGFALGSFAGGMISDKYGRKKPMLILLALSSILELSSAFVQSIETFMALRFFLGVCVGVSSPIYGAFVAEIVPLDLRGKTFPVLGSCFSLGELYACLIGFIFLEGLQRGNWRMILALSSIPAIVNLICCLVMLRESPRYDLVQAHYDSAFHTIDDFISNNNRSMFIPLTNEEKKALILWTKENKSYCENNKSTFGNLFTSNRYKITPLLWIMWFSLSCTYYGIVFSLPEILSRLSSSQDEATSSRKEFIDIFLSIIFEFPACLITFLIIERRSFGRKRSLGATYLLASLSAFVSFFSSKQIFIYFATACKFSIKTSFQLIKPYTSEIYPTHLRSTGFGACSGFSRIGGIIMPWLIMLGSHIRITGVYLFFGIFCFFSFVSTLLLPYDTTGKELDSPDECRSGKQPA